MREREEREGETERDTERRGGGREREGEREHKRMGGGDYTHCLGDT